MHYALSALNALEVETQFNSIKLETACVYLTYTQGIPGMYTVPLQIYVTTSMTKWLLCDFAHDSQHVSTVQIRRDSVNKWLQNSCCCLQDAAQ